MKAFQHRVLLATLELLETEQGPVLVDFPEAGYHQAAEEDRSQEMWTCPVNFANRRQQQTLSGRLAEEIRELKPWYDLRMERSGRTAMVQFLPDSAGRFLRELASGNMPVDQLPDLPMAAVKEWCLKQDDKALRMAGGMLLVPLGQQ